ncbi:MAG: BamA/TamA family outer membrane protein [Rhodobacteraceae bacterium]|nr:BamA/TamA family outer membrane protein [Paracoccaceae bacterium]
MLANASLVHAAKRDGTTAPQDILAAAQADYGRLVGALYARGYYGPVISIRVNGREAANIPPLSNLSGVSRVDLVVSTGPIFRLGIAEIAPLATATNIPDTFRSGASAETSVIRDAARAGVDGWRAIGHAKAQISQQEITADHNQARLDARLRIAPGPRVQFGDLNIAGTSAVREQRIREIAGIPSGAVFDPAVLARSGSRLRRSGAFNLVTLDEAEALGEGDTMDIDLTLADAKPRRFGLGAELHSTEGLALSGFWMHRNLWGGAERLRIEGEVSGLGGETGDMDYKLRFALVRPSTFNADSDFYARGEIKQLDEPHYLSRQTSVGFGIQRYFSETLSAEAGVAYRFSDVDDDLGSRQFSHLMLPLAVTWDRRDDILNPTKGTFLTSEAMPYIGLGKSASGVRGYVDARAYYSVGAKDGVTFAGRLQLGTVVGASLAETPPDWLFFSGGSGTVRGHSYHSLAISTGAVETGGRSFLGISGEIRLRVSKKVAAVGFYDAGYIGANSWIDSTGGWHSGAGLGLRYHSGIGPIRLDVAVPVTGPYTREFQVYVGIGQTF